MLDALDASATRLVRDAERQRIARDLYDSVVQSLTALVADLEYFRIRYLASSGEVGQQVVEKVETWQELARDSLTCMRQAITSELDMELERQLAERDSSADGLTSRETETLKLIARGMIAKEIARTLEISEKTVRNHISSIYRKLDIYDRSQVVIYAMKKGLVDISGSSDGEP
ncbi:MAG TPA: LuxR C-terminal-related transcriptional regulator [Ktedonobacteraceae bacterium]|nr:LuxR C-terminal-related transcriptional regulator [Ktedonobacteraceae bacterium]